MAAKKPKAPKLKRTKKGTIWPLRDQRAAKAGQAAPVVARAAHDPPRQLQPRPSCGLRRAHQAAAPHGVPRQHMLPPGQRAKAAEVWA